MKLIEKIDKHSIYYIKNNDIKYYINIPDIEYKNTNISLEFLENTDKYDPDLNDNEWVKQNIIEYYKQIDSDNITLVMPILKPEEKRLLLTLNVNQLNYIEKLMSLYINSSYSCLIKNNINVYQEVFIIENDKFLNFIRFFKNNHYSRLKVKRLIEVANEDTKSTNEIDDQQTANNINNKLKNIKIDNNINQVIPSSTKPLININKQISKKNISDNTSINENKIQEPKQNKEEIITEKKDTKDTTIAETPPISVNQAILNNTQTEQNKQSDSDTNIKNNNIVHTETNSSTQEIKQEPELEQAENREVEEIETVEKKESIPFPIDENILNTTIQKEQINSNQKPTNEEIKNNITIENVITPTEDEKQKVVEIKKPVEPVKEIIKEKQPNSNNTPNNIIIPVNGVLDLNNLGTVTGNNNNSIPNNVTINIEKVVADTVKEAVKQAKIEEDDDEVLDNELNEDISDLEDMDEEEDFEIDAIEVSEAVLSNDDLNKTYKTVTSGGVKFVVGRKDDENVKPIEINKQTTPLEPEKLNIEIPSNIVKGEDQINKNAGFATYFTLFFVSIFALVIIMYIIIK